MGGDKRMFVGNVVSNYILGDETGSLGAAFTVCRLRLSAYQRSLFFIGSSIGS